MLGDIGSNEATVIVAGIAALASLATGLIGYATRRELRTLNGSKGSSIGKAVTRLEHMLKEHLTSLADLIRAEHKIEKDPDVRRAQESYLRRQRQAELDNDEL